MFEFHFPLHVETLQHVCTALPNPHDVLSRELFPLCFELQRECHQDSRRPLETVASGPFSLFYSTAFLFISSGVRKEERVFYSSEHFRALLHHPIVSFGPHYQ